MLLLLTLRPVLVLVDEGERLLREVPPEVSSEELEGLQHPVHPGLLLVAAVAHCCVHLCRQVDRLPVTLLQQVGNGCIQVLILPLLLPGGCLCN